MELDEKDIKILMEALDAWVEGQGANAFMKVMVMATFRHRGDGEAGADEVRQQLPSLERKNQDREDQAILPKAKLIKMRSELVLKKVFTGGAS